MSDTEKKALALVNEVARELGWGETKEIFAEGYTRNEALFRAIEQHEAFRQEVSDVASVCAQHFCENSWTVGDRQDHVDMLHRLIIPATKPDTLVDVFCKGLWSEAGLSISTKEIRAALEARGLEIREKNNV